MFEQTARSPCPFLDDRHHTVCRKDFDFVTRMNIQLIALLNRQSNLALRANNRHFELLYICRFGKEYNILYSKVNSKGVATFIGHLVLGDID